MNNIGERIRHLRKDISLTLTEFGEHIGITAASLSAIETGKTNPSELTIRAICREFGVNIMLTQFQDFIKELYTQ